MIDSLYTWLPHIKHLHVTLAIASVSFFLLRFVAREAGAAFMAQRWTKTAPALLDTCLLLSGLTLALLYRLSPFAAPWLGVKLLLIVAYIGAGMLAFKAPLWGQRMAALLLALCLITGVAVLAVLKPF
jgi:uncharacterized membrane protein SirB2